MWDCEQLAGKTVYLDANVFIYAFEGSHSLQLPSRAIARIFQMLATYQLSARTSALTRAEVLVHPLRHGLHQLEADYRLLLNGHQGVSVDAISDTVLDKAVQLRAEHRLKLADAIHVASALVTGCDSLISADQGLLRCDDQLEILSLTALSDS